jgi:soluble lytic murein transglycosylase-like protein
VLAFILVGAAGVIAAAMKIKKKSPNMLRIAAGLGWPVGYVQSAAKWSNKRDLPLEWVLATIIVESAGRPGAAGDAGGRSVGLMQVNTVAHAQELAAAGVPKSQMTDPETNIQWGTKYLAEFRAKVLAALGGRTPPAPLDLLVRMAYKGPATIYAALRRGENPVQTVSWVPAAAVTWRNAMARVTALTKGPVA